MKHNELPVLRAEIPESAAILRLSRATVWSRIAAGIIRAQRDGGRTYITREELIRYVQSLDAPEPPAQDAPRRRGRPRLARATG